MKLLLCVSIRCYNHQHFPDTCVSYHVLMLLQYVGLLVPATLNSLRSLCLMSGMLGFVGICLPVRWVDGCTGNRLAPSFFIAFISRPICTLPTIKCFIGSRCYLQSRACARHCDDQPRILSAHTVPTSCGVPTCCFLSRRSIGSISLGVTLIDVLMLSEPS